VSGSFYPGVRPVELIPGDPAALRGLAGRLQVLGGGLGDAASELRTIDASSWQGQAADAFRHVVQEQPGRYSDAAVGFTAASTAIQGFALTLETAQQDASRAIAMHDDADAATSGWQQRVQAAQQAAQAAAKVKMPAGQAPPAAPSVSTSDPGDAGRAQAESVLSRARAQMDQAAARLQANLDAAKHAAPHKPGLFSRLVHGAEHLTKDFVHFHDVILKTVEGAVIGGLKDVGKVELRGLEAELHALGTAGRAVGIDPKGWYDGLPTGGRHFLGGVWLGTVGLGKAGLGLAEFGWKISPTRMMIDPLGWSRTMTTVGKTAYSLGDQAIMHPTKFWPTFGSNMINLQEWKHDPATALGELVPAVVLAVATAGAGMAAEGAVGSAAALAETAESFDAIATVAAADGDIGATEYAVLKGEQKLAERAAVLAKGATQRDLHTVLTKTNMAITGAGTVEAAKGAADHVADGAATGYGVERGLGTFKPPAPEAEPAIVISARVFIPIVVP
jgi:hypothetical protein